jgi:hypothetical protein
MDNQDHKAHRAYPECQAIRECLAKEANQDPKGQWDRRDRKDSPDRRDIQGRLDSRER